MERFINITALLVGLVAACIAGFILLGASMLDARNDPVVRDVLGPARGECLPTALQARFEPELPLRRLCVPPEYVRHPIAGRVKVDLAVTALWPCMAGLYTPGWNRPPRSIEELGRVLNILFGPVRSYPDIRTRFATMTRSHRLVVPAEPAFGLEHLVADPAMLTRGETPTEIYFGGDAGSFVSILCPLPVNEWSPSCTQEFLFDGYLVSVSYSRDFLPVWRDIEEATKTLIAGFEGP